MKLLKIFCLFVGIFAAISAFLACVSTVNDIRAEKLADMLKAMPLPKDTLYTERVSSAGRVSSTGNGIEYFAAILVKSDLSAEELTKYYSAAFSDDKNIFVAAEAQTGKEVHPGGNINLYFKSSPDEDDYYIVYAIESNSDFLMEFDMRGQ